MLKKALIVGAIPALVVLGVGGYAYADDNNTDCTSYDETEQENDGKQIVGGNGSVKDLNGFIGGSIDNGVVCPSGFNDNEWEH